MGRFDKPALLATTVLFMRGLARNRAGNTTLLVAAGIVPLMALVGGGIDMGRSYLSQSRLQQACDAGVLAARKKLGTSVVLDGNVPSEVAAVGNRFFNINFRTGSYGTSNRQFAMTLEDDYSISGEASVDVPTSIMRIFGYVQVPVQVNCEAKLNFSNTDIMMVLDTTGSMNETNSGDSEPRINVLRETVKAFHAAVTGNAATGTRVRFGFMPYATNVSVGASLKSDWMVDEWTYQSRQSKFLGTQTFNFYSVNYEILSGSIDPITPFPSSTCPQDTADYNYEPAVEISSTPHSYYTIVHVEGYDYSCTGNDGSWTVSGIYYNNYSEKQTWTFAYTKDVQLYNYEYKPVTHDVTKFKGATGDEPTHADWIDSGIYLPDYYGNHIVSETWYAKCIEERSTYEIDDYDNVDLDRALDLDIDRVPDPNDPDTQWRPQMKDLIFAREIEWDGTDGAFNLDPVESSTSFLNPGWQGFGVCPSDAMKLRQITAEEVADYVDNLTVGGETYHDIGMIWGGRFISPTGIFADENADVDGKPSSRHLIFLTDGQTMPLDISYSSYGVEPLDRRRWNPDAPVGGLTLREVVEKRFAVACNEVRRKNVTIWVIGFGTEMNDLFRNCAGEGHWFQADDAAELQDVFASIADSMGDLRISK